MENDYIVVIDSGIGGLSTLAKCINGSKMNYYYVADNKNIPYGSHSTKEIQTYLAEIIVNLKKKCDFKIVILACNTATTTSIQYLRNRFKDLIFIGTEPAIKLAYNHSYRNILTITTPATAKQNKFRSLKNSLPCNIKVLSLAGLASNIERYIMTKSYLSYANLLKDIMKIVVISQGFDCIVLGCTHYIFLKQYLKKYTNIRLVDGNDGVKKQLSRIMKQLNKTNNDKFRIKFYNTLSQRATNQIYKKILGQILANAENL